MFDIVFLGTSASAPSIQRGLPSQMVLHREYRFLIDCGEGTQRQILQSGLGFKRLDKILITHSHLDHILGLAGLLSTFMRWEAIEKLEIWAGTPAANRIRDLLYGVVLRGASPPIPLEINIIEPGTLMEDDAFRLSAFPVTHRGGGTFGFLFEEKARRPFLTEQADALGVPAGPLRAGLVAGKACTLPMERSSVRTTFSDRSRPARAWRSSAIAAAPTIWSNRAATWTGSSSKQRTLNARRTWRGSSRISPPARRRSWRARWARAN